MGFINSEEVLIKFKSGYLASLSLFNNVVKNLVDEGQRSSRRCTFLYDYVPSFLLLDKENNAGAVDFAIKDIESKLKICN